MPITKPVLPKQVGPSPNSWENPGQLHQNLTQRLYAAETIFPAFFCFEHEEDGDP